MGSAMKQYKQAAEGFFDEKPETPESKDDRKILLETAKKLGIKTEGKKPEEISEEIIKKNLRKRTKKSVKSTAKKKNR